MKSYSLLSFISALTIVPLLLTAAPNVTNYMYKWEGSQNLAIPIPSENKTNFCLTFEANPKQDLDIGLYSTAYKRRINDNDTVQAAEVTENPTGVKYPLSAIAELAYGGWDNTQSAITLEWHSTRSLNAKQMMVSPNLSIPAQDVGTIRTYRFAGSLTEKTFMVSLSVQDPETKQFKTLMSVCQNDLPPATASAPGESIFDALKKILSTGFTHIGFVGYNGGYTVQNWSFNQNTNTEKIIIKPEIAQVSPEIIPEEAPSSSVPAKQTVTTSAYSWDDNLGNATITIPADKQKNFTLTFKANPKNDFHIGFYGDTYQRNRNSEECVAAKELALSDMRTTPLSAIIECAFGGWGNSQSALRFEFANHRGQSLKESFFPFVIPQENVGVLRTYSVTLALTPDTLHIVIGFYREDKTFVEMKTITQNDLPPLTEQESLFMALQKPTFRGFNKIGFLGYETTYDIEDPVIENAVNISQNTSQAEADRIAAEKAAQDKAAADKALADAAAAKAAADKAEADRIAAEKAAQDKAAADKALADAAAAKAAAAKTESDRLAAEKAAQDKAAQDKAAAGKETIITTAQIPSKPTTPPLTKTAVAISTPKLSPNDIKRQTAATQKYESVKTKLQAALTQAQAGQITASTAVSTTQKLTTSTNNTKLRKDATQLKATMDDYVTKLTKAQTTLTSTQPPFATIEAITRAQKNIDSIEKYANTALALIKQRLQEVSTLQKKIDTAASTKAVGVNK